jgi:hypothetical protein
MTTTEHPVDSTYHPCCNAIGRHGRDCKTEAPLPAGADTSQVDEWQTDRDGRTTRLVWSLPMGTWARPQVGYNDDVVTAVVTQHRDGSIVTAAADAPLVYVGDTAHSPESARELAHSLLAAADWAERATSTG